MDWVQTHLLEAGLLSLREVLRLLLLSGLFTVTCMLAFPRNAPTRRVLLLACVMALVVLPWMLASIDAVWHFAIDQLPSWSLSAAVPNAVLLIWVVVAAWLMGKHLSAVRHEVRSLALLPDASSAELTQQVAQLSQQIGCAVPRIKLGDCACSTTLGKPMLVLPQNWDGWDAQTLRAVLTHEMVHIARRDDQWLLLTRLLVLGYWWMPWLIWLYRLYVRVMEESCDDAASQYVGHEASYVSALVNAALDQPLTRAPINVSNMHVHHLVGRVGRFSVDREFELDTRGIYWCVMGILVFVVGLTGLEPIQRQHFTVLEGSPDYPLARTILTGLPDTDATLTPINPLPDVQHFTRIPPGLDAQQRQRLRFPIHSPVVIYPGAALNAQHQGEVVVEYEVQRDGSVATAKVVQGSGFTALDSAALRAVMGSRYAAHYASPLASASMAPSLDRTIRTRQTRSSPMPSDLEPQSLSIRIRKHFRFRLKEA